MNRQTKSSTKWLKIGALIPIGALLIFVFSEKVLADSTDGPDRSMAGLSENLPENRSPAMAAYLDKYGKYQLTAYENFIFKNRTIEELQALFGVYQEFDLLYLNLTIEERLMVKRPEFPYVRLEKDGVEYYKKLNELNAEERKKIGC